MSKKIKKQKFDILDPISKKIIKQNENWIKVSRENIRLLEKKLSEEISRLWDMIEQNRELKGRE